MSAAPAKRIAFRYTCLVAGGITAVSVVCYLALLLFPQLFLPCGGIGLFAGFLLINGLLVYRTGRRYASAVIARADSACQSEKTFISNASHELNNPLTAIQGECEIALMRQRTPGEYQGSLCRILSETKRIIRLMKQLMFLSKGQEEILRTAAEPLFLAEFLMQFMEKRIQFSPDSFAFNLEVNPQLLKIALENIIGNALKYSGDKTVEICLRGSVLEIEDQGIGVPPQELDSISQPFYRATNTRGYAGAGVGLSLSIRILRMYGAQVTISSALEKGTKVKIDFTQAGMTKELRMEN
jgi:signal transduction histidine kinase